MHLEGRISIRLKDYDYTQGAYFLTLCTVGHVCLFASANDGKLRLNRLGRIVAQEWRRTGELRPEVFLDAWALMPNHVHAMVFLPDKEPVPASAGTGGAHLNRRPRSLGSLVSEFKATATARIHRALGTPGRRIWQRGYFDRVIRSEEHLERVRQYILENPLRWSEDRYFRDREIG
jgi:REP element-mobilizing transposase RayT